VDSDVLTNYSRLDVCCINHNVRIDFPEQNNIGKPKLTIVRLSLRKATIVSNESYPSHLCDSRSHCDLCCKLDDRFASICKVHVF
jgi:hypothetical protein